MADVLAYFQVDSDRIIVALVGSFVAASCALVGTFLVLRRMAMLGDAISHAVLPGIAIAFLLTGDRSPLPMILGAGVLGVLTVFLVGLLDRTRCLREDASIGVTFPALFSIGVILMSRYLDQVHLDIDCVLAGEIGLAPLDRLIVADRDWGPKSLWVTGVVLLVNLTLVLLLYKELKLASFDPSLAAALGISPVVVHYVLMSAVSVTVVSSFESVGAILVVAMLVVPPATAYLITDRLLHMLILAVLLGIASAIGGYALAVWTDASIAGAMAATAGALFVVALVLSPRYGLLARLLSRRHLAARFREHLVLLHLRGGGAALDTAHLARRFNWRRERLEKVIAALRRAGLVARAGDSVSLTDAGIKAIQSAGTGPLRHRV
jgi:manganese/zinc/iron transport system permease protein